MSTASPSAFLLWAILSVIFQSFLIYHLWCYDQFKCLKWSSGRQPGAFKRVMTYSYLGSVPLFVIYSVAMTAIKYKEGFIVTPDLAIIPTPLDAYKPQNHRWIVPLNFVFSFAWGLELVTHLEELAFWLYLLHQNPDKAPWFSSWEYRLWYNGSMIAIVGMPLTALIARHNVDTIDAYIFLTGSCGSTSTTLVFLYVLWRFPRFIKHVKAEGADPTVVVRLATFFQLNQARVVFRFMFTLPLLVLALDGIVGRRHVVNKDIFWTDFLLMIAGIGCFVSTTITLLIFFPRSVVKDSGYKPRPSSTLPNSPKSPSVTPPALSAPFAMNSDIHSHVQSPPFSPASSHAAHLALNMPSSAAWDGDSGSITSPDEPAFDAEMLQDREPEYDPESAPPYPQIYQRHPFPHSLSSPQILSAPSSPQQVRVAMPPPVRYAQEPMYVSYRQNLGTPGGVIHPMTRSAHSQSHDYKHAVRHSHPQSQASCSKLHPYVMTFTSPIDLIGIPDEVGYSRTM